MAKFKTSLTFTVRVRRWAIPAIRALGFILSFVPGHARLEKPIARLLAPHLARIEGP